MRVFIISVLSFLFLTGCYEEIQTPDGKIPSEFVQHATEFEGKYVGTFEGRPREITVQLNSDRTVNINVSADLLGVACMSQMGQLESILYDGDRNGRRVKHVTLVKQYDPNNCTALVVGREMSFRFSKNRRGQIELRPQILESQWTSYDLECDIGGRPEERNCWHERNENSTFLSGRFIKQ